MPRRNWINVVKGTKVIGDVKSRIDLSQISGEDNSYNVIQNSHVGGSIDYDFSPANHVQTKATNSSQKKSTFGEILTRIPIVNAALQIIRFIFPGLH